jgi:BirA family biotin operon repressor/biotin-[acetyl-CoA-carboxylase] ligase
MSSRWSDLARPPLSASRLQRITTAPGMLWREIRLVDETASTNADLVAAARAGEPGNVVLVAESQTAGRGRLDRAWVAPARSSVLLSVLLRPTPSPATWTLLPLLAGVAVVEAVRAVAHVDAVLKWPNDVLVDDRKLAGILVERVDDAVVIGLGVNVSTRVEELPDGVAATSLAVAGGMTDREPLVMEILRALARRYTTWQDDGGASHAVLAAYREICATIGRDVRVELPGGIVVNGVAESVDDTGRLVVRDAVDGATTAFAAGDVVHATAGG